MRPLSKRLQVIFDLVPKGAKVADIGTDHAYLPIALSLENRCKKIIACDINQKPLNKAKENILKFGIENIETRLGNGLSPVKSGEADTIVIAGMGGDIISQILSSCNWLIEDNPTLLLQPMTSAEILRGFLISNRFEITGETPIIEQGKVYTVICAKYSGEAKFYPIGYEYSGLVSAKTEEGRLYLLKQLKRISNCIDDISVLPHKTEETQYLTKVKNHINKLLEIY